MHPGDAVIYTIIHPERVARLVPLNTIFGHQPSRKLPEMIRLFADPGLTPLADAMMGDNAHRLWLLQHTADQWGLDALAPDIVAVQAFLSQFFGDADQPDALPGIRAWTARLFHAMDDQDAQMDRGALGRLEAPVSVIFKQDDRYLNPDLGAEIAGLFTGASRHLPPDAGRWPHHDQSGVLAKLLQQNQDAR